MKITTMDPQQLHPWDLFNQEIEDLTEIDGSQGIAHPMTPRICIQGSHIVCSPGLKSPEWPAHASYFAEQSSGPETKLGKFTTLKLKNQLLVIQNETKRNAESMIRKPHTHTHTHIKINLKCSRKCGTDPPKGEHRLHDISSPSATGLNIAK